MKKLNIILLGTFLSFFSISSNAGLGNESIKSFNKAKKNMLNILYNGSGKTVYCAADFKGKKIINLNGTRSTKYKKRAKRIEFEHFTAAQSWGQTFREWREGDPQCVNKKGKRFKGRHCASKINMEYRYMESDMYNLGPAIGSVNALRSNYRFVATDDPSKHLGDCKMMIDSKNRSVSPPDRAKGIVARAGLYFEQAYPRYNMGKSQRQLFNAWNNQFPVTKDECRRNSLIERIQGNVNHVVKDQCTQKGYQ